MTATPRSHRWDRGARPQDLTGEIGEPESLAARQAALVTALVAGGPVPAGFDAHRVEAAAAALRRKRAGEVASAWPLLAAGLGAAFPARFSIWASGRPPGGSFPDGFAFARALRAAGELPPLGAAELAEREAYWSYDGTVPPRPRRWAPRTLRRLRRGAGRLLKNSNPLGRTGSRA